jgi:hypothetical protein
MKGRETPNGSRYAPSGVLGLGRDNAALIKPAPSQTNAQKRCGYSKSGAHIAGRSFDLKKLLLVNQLSIEISVSRNIFVS